MKDIGSIFPLYDEDLYSVSQECPKKSVGGNVIRFSLCREAIFTIAKLHDDSNRIALLPAYTCQTVIDPFIQQGWTCHYYNIKKSLRIDTEDLIRLSERVQPAVTIVHPYLGMDLNDEELSALNILNQRGYLLVEDMTQCIFSKKRHSFFDYYVGSYRKWTKIPDGGFLEVRESDNIEMPTEVSESFIRKQIDAMYLRGQYFLTGNERLKEISIRLNKEATGALEKIGRLHKMSCFSSEIWDNIDFKLIERKRLENYRYLFENLDTGKGIDLICKDISEVTSAPLYFPIYAKDRSNLQKRLAAGHIYAPVLWPVHNDDVLINENIKFIYNSILMLPVDQRYDLDDMHRIATSVNSYV